MHAAVILNANGIYVSGDKRSSDLEPPTSSKRSKWIKKRFKVLSCTRIKEKNL